MKYSKKRIDEAISYWEKRLHEADGSSSPDKVREDAVRLAYAWWDTCRKAHPDYYAYYSLSGVELPAVYVSDGKMLAGVKATVSTLLKSEQPEMKISLQWVGGEKTYSGWVSLEGSDLKRLQDDYLSDKAENGKNGLKRWKKYVF